LAFGSWQGTAIFYLNARTQNGHLNCASMHEMRHESVLDKGKAQTNENHAPKNLMVDTLRKSYNANSSSHIKIFILNFRIDDENGASFRICQ